MQEYTLGLLFEASRKKEKEEKASQLSSDEKSKQKEIEEMLEDKAIIDKQLQQLAKEEAERIAREKKAQEED